MSILQSLHECKDSLLIATPDGAFTIKDQQGRFVHSSRSPLKESNKLLMNIETYSPEDTLIIVWGVGLGYHVESLVNLGYDVIAVEFRPQLAILFEKIFPIDQLLSFVTNPNTIFDVLVQLSKTYKNFVDISMLGIMIPQEAWTLKNQGVTALKSLHLIKLNLIDTWYLNILQNLLMMEKNNIGYTYEPIFEDKEVIICSAGPSLKESLPYLKKYREYFIIMATDTALLSLIEYGIIPDIVHSVDAKIHNIADFRGIELSLFSQIVLIADISLNSQIVCIPWKKVLFVSTAQPLQTTTGVIFSRHHLQQFLWDNNIRFPETQTGGSVATSAFHLAILYKAKRILLIGQDLAYSNHRGHAVGTPYDKEYRLQTSRLKSLDTIHIHKIPFDMVAEGIHEEFVYTDPLLVQFRSWFEISLKDNPFLQNMVINASENGAYFNFWKHQALSNYTPTILPIKLSVMPKYYTKKQLKPIYQKLSKLEDSEPIMKDYFYQQEYQTDSIQKIQKIQKKKRQWNKKITLN